MQTLHDTAIHVRHATTQAIIAKSTLANLGRARTTAEDVAYGKLYLAIQALEDVEGDLAFMLASQIAMAGR